MASYASCGPNNRLTSPGSGTWHASTRPTRSLWYRYISSGPHARYLRFSRISRSNHHIRLHPRPRAKAASPASRPNEPVPRHSCGASSVNGSVRRAPLRRQARSTVATMDRGMWMCLTGVKWRMRIVSATVHGVSAAGRTLAMTVIAGGTESSVS